MMSHSIIFHSVYFELSTVPKRETMKGVDLYSPLQSFPGVQFDCRAKHLQKIVINRNKSQKIDEIECDVFPNEKIDLSGSIPVTPVAGLIFETKNRAIFLERFF